MIKSANHQIHSNIEHFHFFMMQHFIRLHFHIILWKLFAYCLVRLRHKKKNLVGMRKIHAFTSTNVAG